LQKTVVNEEGFPCLSSMNASPFPFGSVGIRIRTVRRLFEQTLSKWKVTTRPSGITSSLARIIPISRERFERIIPSAAPHLT